MVCCTPSGYIIFSLRKLKFYEGWGPEAGSRESDMRAMGRWADNPKTQIYKARKYFSVAL